MSDDAGSMNGILIRPASVADIGRLAALLSILFAQEADFTPDPERQSRGLRLIIGNPETGRILCAMDGAEITGMVSILFSVSTAEGGKSAWMEDMIVHPKRRGRGIGAQLLQAAIQAAREAGCKRITLLTDSTNEGAMKFYARAGFSRSQMVPFRLQL